MGLDFTIDFDFDAFEEAVYDAARQIFAKLQQDRSTETFYTFNFVAGDVLQELRILANTEEELVRRVRDESQYNDLYMHLPFESLKSYLRYHPSSLIQIGQESDTSFVRLFARAHDLLSTLMLKFEELEDELLESDELEEEDFYDMVYERIDEPITAKLVSVLRRLDHEGAFEVTNLRERIHLGVIQSQWDYDALPGPFYEINPTESCRRYAHYADVYQAVSAALRN